MQQWGRPNSGAPHLLLALLRFIALVVVVLPDSHVCAYRVSDLLKHNVLQGHSKGRQKWSLIQYLSSEAVGQKSAAIATTTAAATTTAGPTTTTEDPKVVEARIQAKIKNASDSQMLAEISEEESRMQSILKDIGVHLNLTEERAARALQYANWTVLNSTDTKTRAVQAQADALTNNKTMKLLLAEFPKLNKSLVKADTKIVDTNASIAKMIKDMGEAAKEKTAMKRATDAEDVLKLLAPRINAIQEHTKQIEHIEHGGNFTLMLDDEINYDLQDSLDDIQEAFAKEIT